MSRWSDAAAWARLLEQDGCPICRDGGPSVVIAELEASVVSMGEGATPLPGSCAVILRRHAVELHELEDDEAAALMRDLRRVSRVVQEATGAVKINLELHGNTIPHLHVHVFPRQVGDPFEHGPIDPRRLPVDVAGSRARHAEARARVRAALA